ncbi:hypothetical protein [Streptomyces sp. NPDC093261]
MSVLAWVAVALVIYAVGYSKGRTAGQRDGAARIVTDFLSKRR